MPDYACKEAMQISFILVEPCPDGDALRLGVIENGLSEKSFFSNTPGREHSGIASKSADDSFRNRVPEIICHFSQISRANQLFKRG